MSATESALTRYLRRALLYGGATMAVYVLVALLVARAQTHEHRPVFRLGPVGAQVGPAELERAAEVLAARLEALRGEFKLSRRSVTALPPDRLEVRFRCAGDPTAALSWLTMQGRAEFRLVHPSDEMLAKVGPEGLPPDYEVKIYREKRFVLNRLGELKTVENPFAVQRDAVLTVGGFREVTFATVGRQSKVVLTFRFFEADAQAFSRVTALHAGRRMAMLIDGEMFFPPCRIESAVTEGSVQVEGFFHIPACRRLAKVLACGSLPAPLYEPAADEAAPAGPAANAPGP